MYAFALLRGERAFEGRINERHRGRKIVFHAPKSKPLKHAPTKQGGSSPHGMMAHKIWKNPVTGRSQEAFGARQGKTTNGADQAALEEKKFRAENRASQKKARHGCSEKPKCWRNGVREGHRLTAGRTVGILTHRTAEKRPDLGP